MGGTFDPIHLGHLRIAEEALEQAGLDRVFLIPNRSPVHRSHVPAPAEDRYAMLLLATAGNPCLEVSRVEMDRDSESYSIDTVTAFGEQFPEAELFFIVGGDELRDLDRWHRAEDLIRLCIFLVAPRGRPRIAAREAFEARWHERIRWLETPLMPISATDVRQRLAEGRSVRYLTVDTVIDYIDKRGLYR